MYKYGGTKRRHRRRHGGEGFSNMNVRESDEYVSELSKRKNKEELERLSESKEGKGKPFKVYEGEGTGTRTPSPMPAAQRVITERARTNSERKEDEVKKEGAARRRTRKHKKHGRKTRHRR